MSASTVPSMIFKRLLLTGAAGRLGRELRVRLKPHCHILRINDIADLGSARPGEELDSTSLEDRSAVHELLKDVDAVVHFGGASTEGAFESLLPANFVGVFNLYEAARQHAVKRIIFASSNHVTGFYPQHEVITATQPVRPDSYYAVSKAFGENLSRFYFDRYRVETVCLRIGSSFSEPKDRRRLAIWLSFDDLERLVVASLKAPVVGHSVIYGVSNNAAKWWDNTPAAHLGFVPADSSEPFRVGLEAREPNLDLGDPAAYFQGGDFVTKGPFP